MSHKKWRHIFFALTCLWLFMAGMDAANHKYLMGFVEVAAGAFSHWAAIYHGVEDELDALDEGEPTKEGS